MHTRLLLAVAIATALSLPCVATAQSASSEARQLAELKAQLAALQSQVEALEDRNGRSDAKPAAPKQEVTLPDTRISGTFFADLTSLHQTSDGKRVGTSGAGLDVKRFYLSIDHGFNSVWSANLTTDFNYVANDGQTQVFVKKAYAQGAFSKLATLRIGSANMAWIPTVEDWYGYRFVENTVVDRMKFGNSADWGLHLLGDKGGFGYQVSVVNGRGYKNPSRADQFDIEARIGMQPIPGLLLAAGTYSGKLGNEEDTAPALHRASRQDAMIAWNRDGLRVGGEWFRATNWGRINAPAGDRASGWSLWSSYDLGLVAVFARHDRVDPSRQLDPSLEDSYSNIGMAFPLAKGLRVAVAYKNQRRRNHADIDTHVREIGAWGELKW